MVLCRCITNLSLWRRHFTSQSISLTDFLRCIIKYEEVSVPVVDDLILISDKAYTRREILDMENLMMNTLQFNFSLPTPYVFMRRYLIAAQSDKKVELLSFFIIELCLVEYEMLQYTPSQLAVAAIYTAQSTLRGFEEWNILGVSFHWLILHYLLILSHCELSSQSCVDKKKSVPIVPEKQN